MKQINKMSAETRERLLRGSAQRLPDRPTAEGMTPDAIRRALWVPMLGSECSLATEQDRLAEEMNGALGEMEEMIGIGEGAMSARLNEESEARVEGDAILQRAVATLSERESDWRRTHDEDEEAWRLETEGRIGEMTEELRTSVAARVPLLVAEEASVYAQRGEETLLWEISDAAEKNTLALRNKDGRLLARTPSEVASGANPEYQVVNLEFLSGKLAALTTAVEPRLSAMETAIAGRARSYVLDGREDLLELLTGRWETGETSYFADELITGDNLLIVQRDVPDFWFEATTDPSRTPETYTYTDAAGNGQTVELRVCGYDNGGATVGLLHVLESDYTVIEGYSRAASQSARDAETHAERAQRALGETGDLSAALDAILALQEKLIGGEAE